MKIPEKPKGLEELINNYRKNRNFIKIISENFFNDGVISYDHWDKIRFKKNENYNPEEIWLSIKFKRHINYNKIHLLSKDNKSFIFSTPYIIQKKLNHLDKECGGSISTSNYINDSHIPKNYFIHSLFEEAISSSQLEGASTTRKVAKKMLENKLQPRNKDEQMISNNYDAMNFIKENKDEALTTNLILELHKIITKDTLDNKKFEGKFRLDDEVKVVDTEGNVLFNPPSFNKLEELVNQLCIFTNTDSSKEEFLVHPIIKGIIIHFYLAYLHPFEDGNGRTARALFYWFMAKQEYWILEYVSISRVIKEAPAQYAKAYLHTETDDNDLTYFIINQLDVIINSIEKLHEYLEKKIHNISSAVELIQKSDKFRDKLNSRQLTLIKHASKHPNFVYTIKAHENYHFVTYQTARNDLLMLSDDFNLFKKAKSGKNFIFISPDDITELL